MLRILFLIFTISLIGSTHVSGEMNIQSSSEDEGLHFAGYLLLFFAFLGWGFFFSLLGVAAYLAIRQFRRPKRPRNPVRCK
ncbi:MAG: hypothetical protein CMB08_01670 [Euryarchaeota archaeon]|nr:hypothetical protein [Euryarchaeota archaeon]